MAEPVTPKTRPEDTSMISEGQKRFYGRMVMLAWVWAGVIVLGGILHLIIPAAWDHHLFYTMAGFNALFLVALFLFLRQIKTSAGKIGHLIHQTRDIFWTLDSSLCISRVYGSVSELTGRSPRQLRHMDFIDLLPEKKAEGVETLLRQNRPFSIESGILRKDGKILPVEISGSPVPGQDAYQGIIRDLSEKKQREKQEKKLKEKLDRSEKLKNLGLLAGSVAHDLNNILSGIATYPEVLLMDDTLDPKVRQGLAMIQASGRKASSVVSDLLTISRGARADKQIININTVVERYMMAAEFEKIRQTYVQVEIEVDTDPELLNISGSYIHIEKAVMNLMLNAVEETADKENGRVVLATANYYVDNTLDASRCPRNLSSGEYVLLSVSDNGDGIPEDCLDKIFDPFYTQKEMGKSGTGLGLTVVLNAVQDHKGKIFVESGPGGTRFELFFPAVREELPLAEVPPSLDEIRGNGEVLLVVDDLPTQRKIAATILRNLGYTVFTVSNGTDALEFVRQTPADLLVLDMVMAPEISGLETYRLIKAVYPDQKAIIASGHSESEDVLKTQELGAGGFVKKPYTVMDMGIAVKEELEK
ncbi:MAG: response regulator [Desulfobacterales bacterium]|nr:response regulator [Desulfobacterales bacterium]